MYQSLSFPYSLLLSHLQDNRSDNLFGPVPVSFRRGKDVVVREHICPEAVCVIVDRAERGKVDTEFAGERRFQATVIPTTSATFARAATSATVSILGPLVWT